MKQFVKPAAIIAATIISAFAQPSFASAHTLPWHKPAKIATVADENFSIDILQKDNEQKIQVTIKNPGRKNLNITLNDPDGSVLDSFFAGKKIHQVDKLYNFSEADAGVYTLIVTDGVQQIKKQIKLEHVSVHVVEKLTVQ